MRMCVLFQFSVFFKKADLVTPRSSGRTEGAETREGRVPVAASLTVTAMLLRWAARPCLPHVRGGTSARPFIRD